ncbi:hypothetical protein G0U57_018977 [Chelydra serpentina]|uniref:Uncharacterized protein n=1 Tax=Chelydra serpentina TaxID=8475 RepID=A0A8T1S594_CHESE|nr:hypothetical protein G0U57_018977 [Chelydra serpentina]
MYSERFPSTDSIVSAFSPFRSVPFVWRNSSPKTSWESVHVNMPSTESASLSGWRCEKCVHSATCLSFSWHNSIISRTMGLPRDPCLGQRTLYSFSQAKDSSITKNIPRMKTMDLRRGWQSSESVAHRLGALTRIPFVS